MTARPLTREERELIANVANRVGGAQCAQLLRDLESATAVTVTDDGSRVRFEISDYQRPVYRGQHPLPVEARMLDRDGAEVTVMVHADENGRLLELEFIRWGRGDLLGPDWTTLKLEPD